MNAYERRAWETLVRLGAKQIELGGKPALDLRPLLSRRFTDAEASDVLGAIVEVAGRSRAVRRHVDRRGNAVFVVADANSVR